MDDVTRRYAERNVPRYTSYPTAADFTAEVGASDHRAWLARLEGEETVSVYLHVPYCREICLYCGCNTKMAVRDSVISGYRHSLEREIHLIASKIARRLSIGRLHWGGGTPSILGVDGLQSVLAVLSERFSFGSLVEHAIELDPPRYVTADLAKGLSRLAVTRASLGVQDINPSVQAAIGRFQPLTVVETAVRRLRSAGIRNLSFDLMHGLPLQTAESVRRTCISVAALSPDRVACFGYAHLPHRRANQRRIDQEQLPSLDQRIDQAETIAEELIKSRYQKVGIDHFARPGDRLARAAESKRLHRNFQGYTDDDRTVLLGFGASAISTFADGIVQNVVDGPKYVRTVDAGVLASQRGCRRGPEDIQRGKVIERLMCNCEADLSELATHCEIDHELSKLCRLSDEGLIEIDGTTLIVKERAKSIVRVIASIFDQFRRDQQAQFSKAV